MPSGRSHIVESLRVGGRYVEQIAAILGGHIGGVPKTFIAAEALFKIETNRCTGSFLNMDEINKGGSLASISAVRSKSAPRNRATRTCPGDPDLLHFRLRKHRGSRRSPPPRLRSGPTSCERIAPKDCDAIPEGRSAIPHASSSARSVPRGLYANPDHIRRQRA
jgi:hypothetical protein